MNLRQIGSVSESIDLNKNENTKLNIADFQQKLEDVLRSTKSKEIGYAYVDKYGFSHVVEDYETAAEYAQEGTEVYTYHGKFAGGYALDHNNQRMAVPLPHTVPYGNDLDGHGQVVPVMEEDKFKLLYPGHLGRPVSELLELDQLKWLNQPTEKDSRYLREQLREVYI